MMNDELKPAFNSSFRIHHSSLLFRRRRRFPVHVGDVGGDGERGRGPVLVLLVAADGVGRGGGPGLRVVVVRVVAQRPLVVGERLLVLTAALLDLRALHVGARQLVPRLLVGGVALGLLLEAFYFAVELRDVRGRRRGARPRVGGLARGGGGPLRRLTAAARLERGEGDEQCEECGRRAPLA